ncbi:MAG: hypothetical protein Q4G63_12900 [Bacteroidia bacterium]|nr:hypothetical protein [Bacteroidia bacterium]
MKVKMVLFMMICPILIFGQTWDYPIKLGTEEWLKMDYQEKLKKSQPSMDVIKSMTTNDIFDNCLKYPFNKEIFLFDNPNERFKILFDNSVLWKEFIKRKDAFTVFKEYYTRNSLDNIAKIADEQVRNNERFNLFFLEKIISETSFVDNLSVAERKDMMRIILEKHISKKNYPEEYLGFSYNSTLSAMRKIIIVEKLETKNIEGLKTITEDERFVNDNLDKEIIELSKKIISK